MIRRLLEVLVLTVLALALTASAALAAPGWSVSLTNEPTTMPRSHERMVYVATVENSGDAPSSGPLSLAIELPGGEDTSVFNLRKPPPADETEANSPHLTLIEGWTCATQGAAGETHASVTCTRSDGLAPGAEYPAIAVVVHLGEDSEAPTGIATATVSGGGAGSPASDTAEYTFEPLAATDLFGPLPGSFDVRIEEKNGTPNTTAGGHPYQAFSTFGFNAHRVVDGEVLPIDNVKDTLIDTSRGFVGNALATPELCQSIEDVILGTCPAQSAVGGIDVYTSPPEFPAHNIYPGDVPPPGPFGSRPIYSIEPEYGQPAQFGFGFMLGHVPYTFVPELRAAEGYAITFRTAPIIMYPPLMGVNVTLCDFGAELETGLPFPAGSLFKSCKKATSPTAFPAPLITNPTRCAGGLPTTGFRADSWQHPGDVKTAETTLPAFTGCDKVKFEPQSSLVPTNHEADTPTGLAVELTMPTDGVLSNTGVAQASLDNVTVTFPAGMSINPASASGLAGCSLAQIKLQSNDPDECPESARVGRIELETPLVREPLHGSIYVASQGDNPFASTIGLYMVFSSPRDGVTVKIAGKVEPDPVTGQLVSKFVENPEWPFSHLALHFNEGQRAPLVNPPKCGTYAIHSEFSPWSAASPANPTPEEIVSQDSTYEVTSGPGGSPCPNGDLAAKMNAGLQSVQAGAKSPFELTLTREDGSDRFTGLDVSTPSGLTAYLKGVPYCPDDVLASISDAEGTGRAELEHPACPVASQVGTVTAASGSGPFPFQAPGRVYLAGPYKGAPVSLAVVTPAVAGPFDLGNVIIRNALYVNPETAQVTTKSDPIPTILHGILLNIRQVKLNLERPGGFTAAPTSCNPMSIAATVFGQGGSSAALSNPFQVGGCENLGFKPKLALKLLGGVHRGANPRLVANLTMPEGGANIASTSVALPHSMFLDQSHIRTVCTRVQFAADACPAAAVYGQAEATTPLLSESLSGPVYMRSSSHELPDLVAALKGPDNQPIEVDLVGRIDSVNGGIRTTFESVPDQPVSSFTLRMQGGKKGLLENAPAGTAKTICAATMRATAVFNAQNGRSVTLRPKLQKSCGKKKRKSQRGSHRSR